MKRASRPAVVTAVLLLSACCTSCTPIGDRAQPQLNVRVDADDTVRAAVSYVEVVVESRAPNDNSWRLDDPSPRFMPTSDEWPLSFRLDQRDARAIYQATATARDDAGAVTIQARAIVDLQHDPQSELRVRFDHECLFRSTLCGRGLTCAAGACVDAHGPLPDRDGATADAAVGGATTAQAQGVEDAHACGEQGARMCAGSSDVQPLVCRDGQWRSEAPCADALRCDAASGTCQPQAAECASRNAGDRFCDSTGAMRVCQANQLASQLPCLEGEQCVASDRDVHCACMPGFVPDVQGCVEATDCRQAGGCDPLTKCELNNGTRSCTMCPPGYRGRGDQGCAPLLSGLRVSPGHLEPAFDPQVELYTVELPALAPRLSIEAQSELDAALTIVGASASSGKAWTSDVLASSDTELTVTLRASSGAHSDYRIVVRRGGTQTYLKPSMPQTSAWFGGGIAAYGDTLVVTAPQTSSDQGANVGSAYVFVRDGGRWRQQAQLFPSHPMAGAYFGIGVAIEEDRIAIGAPGDIVNALPMTRTDGEVEVFQRHGETWSSQQTFTVNQGNGFGFALALHQDTLMIGAPLDSSDVFYSGAAYVYQWDGSSWQQQARLKASPAKSSSHFGLAIALGDQTLAAGAWMETVDDAVEAGAVYTYAPSGSGWSQQRRLVSPNLQARACFGAALALQGDTLVIAAPHSCPDAPSDRYGEVQIWKRSGDDFMPVQVLQAPQPITADYFGNQVSLTASALLIGAPDAYRVAQFPSQAPGTPGAAHLYARTDTGFVRMATLKGANGGVGDFFGATVVLTDTYAAVGAYAEDSAKPDDSADNSLSDSGAVFTFE